MCFISVDLIFGFGSKFCFSALVSLSFGDSACLQQVFITKAQSSFN